MNRRPGRALGFLGAALALSGAWAGMWAGACAGTAGASPTSGTGGAAAALEQSWTTGAGTWAVVAMGHFDEKNNTFWQVFFRPANAARWTLVTPPGTASNGGFSAAASASDSGGAGVVTAGFQPAIDLTYSPIAQTRDDGATWAAGTLPTALLPVADAVAGDGRAVFALVRSGGGTLVRSDRSLTTWRPVESRRRLDATPAGRRCDVEALTALVVPTGDGTSPELGAACASVGVPGLFHKATAGWVATHVPAVGGTERSRFTVLRLTSAASGTSALLEARRGRAASLVALWRRGPAAPWRASAPARLKGSVLSTTAPGTGQLVVVTGEKFKAGGILWVAGPGAAWRSLGRPPAGTQVVTPSPVTHPARPGAFDDLVVSGSELTVWERPAGGPWRPTAQRARVPIEYGSST